MFGNKIKLSVTHDEIRVLVYALNELRNALIYAEGLEWEGVRSSSWAECYPDYDWLRQTLIDELGLE